MPVDYKLYPKNWHEFSKQIRFERAKNRCECTGQCGRSHKGRCTAINGEIGKMGLDGIWRTTDAIHCLNSDVGMCIYPNFDFIGSKVCLTVAHLDFDGGVCQCKKLYGVKCAIAFHCAAFCNFCHLMMDLPHRVENRRNNLAKQKDSARGLFNL